MLLIDFAGWLFFIGWVFAIVCCTELGWRIPIISNILFLAEQRAQEQAKKIEDRINGNKV